MKTYISADIEGTTGIASWSETELSNEDSKYFRNQMTKEVNAACEGVIESGCTDILVKDAHDSARNIDPSKLPECVKIMRGWTKDPLSMMSGMDKTFDAAIFTGYHSAAGTCGNPLAHTEDLNNEYVKINGKFISEMEINAYAAAYVGVPVVLVTGDKLVCETAKELNKNIKTVAVNEGMGNASISINPNLALKLIKKAASEALKDDLSKYMIELPKNFKIEVRFREHWRANKGSYYPGAKRVDPKTISYENSDYFEILRFMHFVL